MDDWQLLHNYLERDSEAAFRTLVNRHANLVYSVALRQVRDTHLAEEVAQAVFILLARKARELRSGVVLSGWLFRTTRFVASRAVRTEQRRQLREQEAFAMQQFMTADDAWKRIAPGLDEALEHLGETDRNAVLLRFYSDKSHRETAVALGVSEDAAKKRVTRALDKLRDFFAHRGVKLSATVLATALATHAAKAATPETIAGVVAKVSAGIGVAAGAAPLPTLVSQTISAWRWAKLKLASAGLAIGTVAVTLIIWAGVGRSVQSKSAPAAVIAEVFDQATMDSPNTEPVVAGKTSATMRTMRLQVISVDDEAPVANVRMAVRTVTAEKWEESFDFITDEAGELKLPVPAELGRLDVGIIGSGWAGRFMTWRRDQRGEFPEQYTLRAQRVTNFMGGLVHDETGMPVRGVEIWMQWGSSGDHAARETPRERQGFFNDAPVAVSDGNGRWSCAVMAATNRVYYSLSARHPDFAMTDIASANPAQAEDSSSAKIRQLWAGNLVTTLDRGITLIGRVTNQAGQPISQARIVHQPQSSAAKSFEADGDGRFVIKNLSKETFPLVVTAPGYAPEFREVVVQPGIEPLEVQLKPGARLRLRLVDEQGQEVPEANVVLEQWGEIRDALDWRAKSGVDGCIEWDSAPREKLQLCAYKAGWCYTRDVWVTADEEEHAIVLRRAVTVSGYVTDAETGAAVEEFKAFPGYGGTDFNNWERLDTRQGKEGFFTLTFKESREPWRVQIEAEGYVPFVSDPLPRDFTGRLAAVLQRPDLSKAVRGLVLRPDGRPASGAEVALLTPERLVYLGRARFAHREVGDKLFTDTDSNGWFHFANDPGVDGAHTIIAVGESGFARMPLGRLSEPLTIQLQPWGRVEGTVHSSARRRPIDSLKMQVQGAPGSPGTLQLGMDFHIRPFKGDGFVFELVPPGDFYVCLNAGAGILYPEHHRTWLTVKTGETTKILVAERGHQLKGRLVATEGEGDWTKQSNELTYDYPGPGVRVPSHQYIACKFAQLVPLDRELGLEENASYNNPAVGDAASFALQHNKSPGVRMDVALALAADGSFESQEGVVPGVYRLRVSIDGRSFEQQAITVPEIAPAEIDLGIINVNTNAPVTGHVVR